MQTLSSLIKHFIPAKGEIREETKAQGEGQLALAETSFSYWQDRLGWSPLAARYLATAFSFGVRENAAAVLEKAQELSESENFEESFTTRVQQDQSIVGSTLEAAKFTANDEIRNLLGRILAGDLDRPGSVSRRTVSVAGDLSPQDLSEFLKLRSVTWTFDHPDADACLLVLGPRVQQYGSTFIAFDSDTIGINFHTFGEFQQLGLLQERYEGNAITTRASDAESPIRLLNGSRNISLRPTTNEPKLQLGVYAFTKAGSEIIRLFLNEQYPEIEGYFEEVCASWCNSGVEITEVIDTMSNEAMWAPGQSG